jgi:hypothetical protein
MKELKIEGFARDKQNYALLNVDKAGYEEYRRQRNESQRVHHIESEVKSLKDDISEIKNILLALLNGNKNV